jgi:hypothetical protein
MPTPWTASNATQIFSQYCAPTVVAAIFGVPRTEAAELLASIPGMPYGAEVGGVCTVTFSRWLVADLGGTQVDSDAIYAAHPSHTPDRWSARLPTVAQFLRRYSSDTVVIFTDGHVLLAQDGEVLADSLPTRSKRARVQRAILLPDRAKGLVGDDLFLVNGRIREREKLLRERREALSQKRRTRSPSRFFTFTFPGA